MTSRSHTPLDIQKIQSGWRKQQIQERMSMNEEDYQAVRKVLLDTLEQLNNIRNDTLEEVAIEFEKMKVFEADTMASIAVNIRSMKR